jgi:hypothetical protein
MNILKQLKQYKAISTTIKDLESRIVDLENKMKYPKLAQRLNDTGLGGRYKSKLDTLLQLRYKMECESRLLRLLVFLNLA